MFYVARAKKTLRNNYFEQKLVQLSCGWRQKWSWTLFWVKLSIFALAVTLKRELSLTLLHILHFFVGLSNSPTACRIWPFALLFCSVMTNRTEFRHLQRHCNVIFWIPIIKKHSWVTDLPSWSSPFRKVCQLVLSVDCHSSKCLIWGLK